MPKVNNAVAPNSKADKIMNGIAIWCSFYRANPHRFCKDFLNLELKLFQKILLFMMNYSNYFLYLASRGQGKTFLVAIFCCVRCILYPATQICVAAKARPQAINVLEKITTILMPNSANLRSEIKETVMNNNAAYIEFHNGSRIKVVTANDNARSNRSNIIVVDEFRMVDIDIINKVLRKFNTAPRQPKYLNKPEYKHLIERNKELYLSSCFYKSHWSWNKTKAYCKALLDDSKKYFISALPYQLAIKESLLSAEQVADEMSEEDFSDISWLMEMDCLWFGESENAFFTFDELLRTRKVPIAVYEKKIYDNMGEKGFKFPAKKNGEIRLIVADIAVMGGSKNDATAIFIIQLLPTDNYQYIRNVIYAKSIEGGHTESQAIILRRMYEEFECSYLCVDTYGVGIGIFDHLVKDLIDDETGEIYEALSCINDEDMAKRYKGNSQNPPKVIYSIKASQAFNSEAALSLRDNLKRGKMRLLISETEAEEYFNKYKSFYKLSPKEKVEILSPYIQTTLLINEMVNLENEGKNGVVKLKEKSTARKDKYSALSYGNQVCNYLERNLKKPNQNINNFEFKFRPPQIRKL